MNNYTLALLVVMIVLLVFQQQQWSGHTNKGLFWSAKAEPKVEMELGNGQGGSEAYKNARCPADYLSQKLLNRDYTDDMNQLQDFNQWASHAKLGNDFKKFKTAPMLFRNMNCESKYLVWDGNFNNVRQNDTLATYFDRERRNWTTDERMRAVNRYAPFVKECNNECGYDPETHRNLMKRLEPNTMYQESKDLVPYMTDTYDDGPMSTQEQRTYHRRVEVPDFNNM